MHDPKRAAPKPQGRLNAHETVRTAHPDSVQSAHTGSKHCADASVQSEETPLEIARREVALVFMETLHRRSISMRSLAHRILNVDESIVRKWMDGRKPIPLAALLVLPYEVAREIVDRIFATRAGRGDRAAALAAMRQRALEDLPNTTGDERARLLAEMRKTARDFLNATEDA